MGGTLAAGFTELRVWDRALYPSEIAESFRRRITTATGLNARVALAGDSAEIAGRPGETNTCWIEDSSLVLSDKPLQTRAAVKSYCELVADQDPTNTDAPPLLAVDLTAIDAHGDPIPGKELTVVLSDTARLYRSAKTDQNLFCANTGIPFTINTDARGKARLLVDLDGKLLAPIFQLRHEEMAKGEWTLVTPDTAIHQALMRLTGTELTQGRAATLTTKPQTTGLIANDGDALAKLLRGLLGSAAAFSFEGQSTAALAFNEGAEPEQPALLEALPAAGSASNYELPEGIELVRRVGPAMPMTLVGEDLANSLQSFSHDKQQTRGQSFGADWLLQQCIRLCGNRFAAGG